MLISFGRKQRRVTGVLAELSNPPTSGNDTDGGRQTCLIDVRQPAAFASGFVPGSYSISDEESLLAAGSTGLCRHRSVYLLADDAAQVAGYGDGGCFGPTAKLEGWFSAEALDEWQMRQNEVGFLEAISTDTLAVRMAAWNTIAIKVAEPGAFIPGVPSEALNFGFSALRSSLDGLPTESSLCVICRTNALATFAASLIWNFGFHKVAYLGAGK